MGDSNLQHYILIDNNTKKQINVTHDVIFKSNFNPPNSTWYDAPLGFDHNLKEGEVVNGSLVIIDKIILTRVQELEILNNHHFRCNDEEHLDLTLDFSQHHIYGLYKSHEVDSNGDVNILNFYVDSNDLSTLAVKEERIYHRSEDLNTGIKTIRKESDIYFYRFDDTFYHFKPKDKIYNNDEIENKDFKSRNNLIHKAKIEAVKHLAQIYSGIDFKNATDEAGLMFLSLSSELDAYKESVIEPLINSLNSYTRTTIINDALITVLVNILNIHLY